MVNDNEITIGLSNIKGIGNKVADTILDIRDNLKSFNLVDILTADIPDISILAKVGVFDSFGIRRFEVENMINKVKDAKYSNKELINLINEKEEKIDALYEALIEESGLDKHQLLHRTPSCEKMTESLLYKRYKAIDDLIKQKKEFIAIRNDLINDLKEIEIELSKNPFKVTLEDKQVEKELTGFYLGDSPIEMANIEHLKSIAQNYDSELVLSPNEVTEKEAVCPVLITGGGKYISRNANEYMVIKVDGQNYRSFDADVIGKAWEEGLLEDDSFAFYLVKMQKKGDWINVTDILEPIEISRNEIIISVPNRKVLDLIKKSKKDFIRVYIANENKFIDIQGELPKSEHIKIYQK